MSTEDKDKSAGTRTLSRQDGIEEDNLPESHWQPCKLDVLGNGHKCSGVAFHEAVSQLVAVHEQEIAALRGALPVNCEPVYMEESKPLPRPMNDEGKLESNCDVSPAMIELSVNGNPDEMLPHEQWRQIDGPSMELGSVATQEVLPLQAQTPATVCFVPRASSMGQIASMELDVGIHVSAPMSKPLGVAPTEGAGGDSSAPMRHSVSSNNATKHEVHDAPPTMLDLFGANDAIVKRDLDQDEYDVSMFYKESGMAQWIGRSDYFANFTLMVILCNTIYIGIDADLNPAESLAESDLFWQICEFAFCGFFVFEWLVRFAAFRKKCDCLRDLWFKFDTALVIMMVFETWFMPLLFAGSSGPGIPTGLVKMLRLLRLARLGRLMRSVPELVAMIKGVRQAARAVASALLLLLFLIYIFAIVMFTLLKDEKDPEIKMYFDSLGTVMWTLLIDGSFVDELGRVTRTLWNKRAYAETWVFLAFVLSSALLVMNMLIGVLCEVVSAVGQRERDTSQIKIMKDQLLWMLRELDEDGSGGISKAEIDGVLHHSNSIQTLELLEVNASFFMDQLEMVFEEVDELTIVEIMELILLLRGDRPLTVKAMIHYQTYALWKFNKALDKGFEDCYRSVQNLLPKDMERKSNGHASSESNGA